MTIYKGLVKDRETKQYEVVTGEYTSKKAFVEDIRRNGLSVNPSRVKTVAVYDAIIKYTDGSELAWRLCKTVKDAENWDKMLDAHLIEEFKRLHPEYNNFSEEQPTVETVEEIGELETIANQLNNSVVTIEANNKTITIVKNSNNDNYTIGILDKSNYKITKAVKSMEDLKRFLNSIVSLIDDRIDNHYFISSTIFIIRDRATKEPSQVFNSFYKAVEAYEKTNLKKYELLCFENKEIYIVLGVINYKETQGFTIYFTDNRFYSNWCYNDSLEQCVEHYTSEVEA